MRPTTDDRYRSLLHAIRLLDAGVDHALENPHASLIDIDLALSALHRLRAQLPAARAAARRSAPPPMLQIADGMTGESIEIPVAAGGAR